MEKLFLERNFKLAVALMTSGFSVKRFARIIDEENNPFPVFHLEAEHADTQANELAAHSKSNGEALAAEVDAIAKSRGLTQRELCKIGFHYALTALQNRASVGKALRATKALIRRSIGAKGRTAIYREGASVSDINKIIQ